MIDVFISHSGEDSRLASQLVNLLRASLNLSAQQVRCTSLDGYRLPAGADTDEQLREEALAAHAFIAILSPFSLASPYVLFEFGARWGAERPFVPLLAPGMGYQSLRGPLTGFNALNCETAGQLHQLVSEVRGTLGIESESPAVYQRNIDAILYFGHSQESRAAPPHPKAPPSGVGRSTADRNKGLLTLDDDYPDDEQVIRRHCEREWPDDYNMRNHCTKQQRQALAILKQGRPDDIPEDVFARIRGKCAVEWPEDYSMRQYCERQQFDSYRELERESE
jgi:hypothetical protein